MDDPHAHEHFVHRSGWLRAAMLGANDGAVSISALLIGVVEAQAEPRGVLIAGVAGLVAGAMSMAAGEYVSVSSQADIERADIAREQAALRAAPERELDELTRIYRARGVSAETAQQVAREMTEHDALAAHLRDDLGLSEHLSANPLQAACASALSFTLGAAPALAASMLAPPDWVALAVAAAALATLAALGAAGALAGGAPVARAAARALCWGVAAMLATAGIGRLFDLAL